MESNTEYHADLTHYGSSALKLFANNPLEFYHAFILGQPRPGDSKALAVGRAFHAAMDGSFPDEIAVAPEVDRRTKSGKAVWEAFEEDCGGKTVISKADERLVIAMAEAVWDHRLARELVRRPGDSERSHRFTRGGVNLKVRWDKLLHDGDVIEFKTLDAAGADTVRRFGYACRDFRYDVQAALYSLGRDNLGMAGAHWFVVVTKTIPSQCMLVRSTDPFLARGRQLLDRTIEMLGVSLAREAFHPGPHNWLLPCFTEVQEIA